MYNIPIILRYIHCIDYVTMWIYIIRVMNTLHYHNTRRRSANYIRISWNGAYEGGSDGGSNSGGG